MKSILLGSAIICLGATAWAQTTVSNGGILNAASNAVGQPVAPGSLVSIYGSNLASALTQASTVPLSTKLDATSVTFNGIAAPLLFVAGGQINAQVPWEVTGTSAQVVVTNGDAASVAVSAPLTSAAPGIFAANGMAIAYGNSDGAFAWPAGSVSGLAVPPHAAKIGDPTTLVILATGLGAVNPPVGTGNIPTDGQLHPCVVTPTVTVGGVPAQVFFSGMSPYVGVYQLNVIIQPGTPTGNAVPLQLTMNGVQSNAPTIAVTN